MKTLIRKNISYFFETDSGTLNNTYLNNFKILNNVFLKNQKKELQEENTESKIGNYLKSR